MRELTD